MFREDGRPMTIELNQEAGDVYYASDIRSILDAMCNTPPQVDISPCRNIRRRSRSTAIEVWGSGTLTLLILPKSSTISSSEKVIAHASRYEIVRFVTSLIFIDLLTFLYILLLWYPLFTDVRTYFRPADRQRRTGGQRTAPHRIFEGLSRPTSEGDQKKGGNQPGPAKPEKPKPEKPKPQREGDKGKRKGKGPRTEGVVAFIEQKNSTLPI